MHALHHARRTVHERERAGARIKAAARADRVVVEHAHAHRADRRRHGSRRHAADELVALARRADRVGGAKLAQQATRRRHAHAAPAQLDERAAVHRPGARAHRVHQAVHVLEGHAIGRVLLLVLRQLDAHRAARVLRSHAVQLGLRAPRRRPDARVEAAREVAELRGAPREALARHVDERAARDWARARLDRTHAG